MRLRKSLRRSESPTMGNTATNAVENLPSLVPEHLISERAVGLILAGLTVLWVFFIIICDSIVEKKFVISINMSRLILDGLTFTTGVTVALVFVDPTIFAIVASNYVYATVTSLSCVIGPVINLAERYGRILNR
jgi:hypothetical protein